MMPIAGYSDMLTKDPDLLDNKDEALAAMQDIYTAARDAVSVVDRLREFYRPPEGDGYTTINVSEIAEQAVSFTRSRWDDETREVRIDLQTDLCDVPPVMGDETELREVFANLILNSVDAMPDGGTITVRTGTHEGRVVAEVEDTGSGMSEDARQRCLEPFFSTKVGQAGSGLGLSMVHGIIKRHKGRIDIQSEVGKGTKVSFRLPGIDSAEWAS
jgi:signal transduction histidine kinase